MQAATKEDIHVLASAELTCRGRCVMYDIGKEYNRTIVYTSKVLVIVNSSIPSVAILHHVTEPNDERGVFVHTIHQSCTLAQYKN